MMKVLICGGRDFGHVPKDNKDPTCELQKAKQEFTFDTLDEIFKDYKYSQILIISGGAKGADASAATWAIRNLIDLKVLNANWIKYGKAAGPIRNEKMIRLEPDFVIAFPGKNGTSDMIKRAKRNEVPVREIYYGQSTLF